MSFFYLNQNFPLSEKLWKDVKQSFEISFFKEKYLVDTNKKKIIPQNFNCKIPNIFYPLLLSYYKKRDFLFPNSAPDFVAVEFRKDWGLFFRGVHSLKEELILKTIDNSTYFESVLKKFNSIKTLSGDISFTVEPMKNFYLSYIFWDGDGDFPPSLKILFDKRLASIFMQDILWSVIVESNYRIKIHEKYFSFFY